MNTPHVVLITGASSGFGKLTTSMKVQSFMVVAAVGSLWLLNGCGGKRPDNIGVVNNSLVACPASPNCVSSLEEEDAEHAIAPLTYTGTLTDARQRLLDVIQSMKRTEIVTADEQYIHAEFRSALFRFVDDVEFYFADEPGIIHVRSASRVGHSDLGVNRKRIEAIRERYGQPDHKNQSGRRTRSKFAVS